MLTPQTSCAENWLLCDTQPTLVAERGACHAIWEPLALQPYILVDLYGKLSPDLHPGDLCSDPPGLWLHRLEQQPPRMVDPSTRSRIPTSLCSTIGLKTIESGDNESASTKRSWASKVRTRRLWSTCWRLCKEWHGVKWSIKWKSWWKTPQDLTKPWSFWTRLSDMMLELRCPVLWRSSSTRLVEKRIKRCWTTCRTTQKLWEKWKNMASNCLTMCRVGCFFGDLAWRRSRNSSSSHVVVTSRTMKLSRQCTTCLDKTTRPVLTRWWLEKEVIELNDGNGMDKVL